MLHMVHHVNLEATLPCHFQFLDFVLVSSSNFELVNIELLSLSMEKHKKIQNESDLQVLLQEVSLLPFPSPP